MRIMTFFKPLIAACLLLLAGGCVSPRPQEGARPASPAIARIEARGVLLVGSTGDYRPLPDHRLRGAAARLTAAARSARRGRERPGP